MKMSQVKEGHVYEAKVSAKIVPVLLLWKPGFENRPRYECVNLNTNRTVYFKTAGKFRRELAISGDGSVFDLAHNFLGINQQAAANLLARKGN
jgi:hypothetical protein